MDFDLNELQQEIQRTATSLLGDRSTLSAVRAAAEQRQDDPELWRELCGLGWPGIAVSEDGGGEGLGIVELAILAEQCGYHLAATPFVSSALTAAVIDRFGSDDLRQEWLGGLTTGELRGAMTVMSDGEGPLAADAPGADVIVLADGELRIAAAADLEIVAVDAIDPTRRYGRVVAADGAGTPAGAADAALSVARTVNSAELVGIAHRALDLTVAFVKDRRQFEVPVGSFQAVSHKCALMLRHVETARSAVYAAAWAADASPEQQLELAAIAHAASSDAAREVTSDAIQLHGGIGFTWEADLHWLFKRAFVGAGLYGDARTSRKTLARDLASRVGQLSAR